MLRKRRLKRISFPDTVKSCEMNFFCPQLSYVKFYKQNKTKLEMHGKA